MKKILLIAVLSVLNYSLFAQTIFVKKGKIEFERKINLHKLMDSWSDDEDGGGNWIANMKKTLPQFKSSYFNLFFNNDKTLYKPGKELPRDPSIPDWFNGAAAENVVFTNLSTAQSNSQKTVYDNTYLITDTVRKIDWRITSELRTIAGFECHKAVARIMDSVYIIAFYTDQIISSGGPEGFSGLPGMILGLAIPRMNTTYFATKLELVDVAPTDLAPPQKGKKVNNANLMKQLQSSFKDWGKNWQRNVWTVML